MPIYTHGGDIVGAQSTYAGEVLDFSANLNPLGMPEAVRCAAQAAVAGAVHYPDSLCRALCAGIAVRDGGIPEQVLCGGGAADLIFRLVYAEKPRRALITAPTFSEYEQALSCVGCGVHRHVLEAENCFDLTESVLEALEDRLELAFFCTPNNPTGRSIPQPLLRRILDRCAEQKIRVVVDECFLELSDEGGGGGLARYIEDYPNLVLLRAFTKSYAIPGLRLGYCLTADTALLERMVHCGPPWAVSTPAQTAGLSALRCPEYPAQARILIQTERSWLVEKLTGLGLSVVPSAANFLLFRAAGIGNLKERLLSRGVLIRACANYAGLGPEFYRVAVRPHPENEILIKIMKEVL